MYLELLSLLELRYELVLDHVEVLRGPGVAHEELLRTAECDPFVVTRTETGVALQATAQDRDAAALMGISTQRMFALGWGLGAGCVGLAGALLANFFYIDPEVGVTFALIAYVTVALGGFGSVAAALPAGIVIGLVENMGGLLIAPAFKYAVVFSVYLVVVFLRPQGIMGKF